MAHKAIAATLASVLLFTALVVADSTMMAAENNLLSSEQLSHIESRELLLGESLAGASSVQLLSQVQDYVSSHAAGCSELQQYLGSISAQYSTHGEDSGINYSAGAEAVTAQPGYLPPHGDNLSLVAPFSGFVSGELDLVASVHVSEKGGGGAVIRQKDEVHLLHLPVSPGAASSLCTFSLGSLSRTLSSSCNATVVQASFEAVLPRLVQQAASQGFALTAGWGFLGGGAGCSVSYWVTLVEYGIEGVTGTFDWTVQGSGTTA
ncbi:MAG: hypothetical protein OK455_03920 [Thaumarchaeota archaeon]|nr:hypothetical protein [Nitrososphaerota archaeon]